MSWKRVIQDSDEDEPFADDEVKTSFDPLQGPESPRQQETRDLPAVQQSTHRTEHAGFPEPQLGVNFDQFLQSQDQSQTAVTSSQLQREERWIPSTGDGGGSIGAMMTEIGLAQQRLFDDEGTNVDPNHSISTTYPSGISEPGSYPMHYQTAGPGEPFEPVSPLPNMPQEPTQLVAPPLTNGFEYSTPAPSKHVDSTMDQIEPTTTFATSTNLTETTHTRNSGKAAQRSKSMQNEWNSPHDTEPNSSVRSPKVSRSKSDNGRAGLMSPQHSPASTRDELSMPAVTVQVAPADVISAKKKRGRPKKQSLPEEDEDDELALVHNSISERTKTEKRRPGRPSKSEKAEGTTGDHEETGSQAADPSVFGSKASKNAEPSEKPEPKKRPVQRSKTAPGKLQKRRKIDDNDDVIWVESKTLEVEDAKGETDSTTLETTKQDAPEAPPISTESPALKKRGRKRRKTAEQTSETQAAPAEPEKSEHHLGNLAPNVEAKAKDQPLSIPEQTPNEDEKENTGPSEETQSESTPQPAEPPVKQTPSGSLPQTPQPENPRKTHSPISSTSKVPYRVGLSKRARIAPLLKVVRK
ncbi:hypothetical protein N7532_005021 [Penicillium argentinense]|uniref:AT hook domain-containing protein n=1 Tax=Penicillium argentinense TaxID=1131581 RepID=A0A9W9FDD4_9EURO|nr:uncharacterized protein N7532_005021 [Penicillium argentinense]KAJ5098020.1 hypothetical protein N7532_005021 [Penicillium argentinense]